MTSVSTASFASTSSNRDHLKTGAVNCFCASMTTIPPRDVPSRDVVPSRDRHTYTRHSSVNSPLRTYSLPLRTSSVENAESHVKDSCGAVVSKWRSRHKRTYTHLYYRSTPHGTLSGNLGLRVHISLHVSFIM